MNAPWNDPAALGATTEASPALLEAMLHAVWLVDAGSLRIVGANAAAAALCGAEPGALIGRPVLDFAVTPEDHVFWAEAAQVSDAAIDSDALVRRVDGAVLPVVRRISRVGRPGAAGAGALYVVALDDRSAQRKREHELELAVADLQATLESLGDGILVVDLRGAIGNFNRRFADLWELPDEMLGRRADDTVLDWMRACVVDPARYMRRLAVIDDATMLRASDVLTLRSGRVIERVTVPQCSRGQPIGRVFTFREIGQAVRELRPLV
ncbi:MAG: PAS domain-containing protein [Caldimonas sp.]